MGTVGMYPKAAKLCVNSTVAGGDPQNPRKIPASHSLSPKPRSSFRYRKRNTNTNTAIIICSMSTIGVADKIFVSGTRNGASTAQSIAAINTKKGPRLYLFIDKKN